MYSQCRSASKVSFSLDKCLPLQVGSNPRGERWRDEVILV